MTSSAIVRSRGPRHVARLGRAFAEGLLAAGIQPVGKHAPGHGRARVDSHLALPTVEANHLDADILPFARNADLPWMMTAHIVYPAFDPGLPATLSPWSSSTDHPRADRLPGRPRHRRPRDEGARRRAARSRRSGAGGGVRSPLYCSGEFAPTEALLAVAPPCRIGHASVWLCEDKGGEARLDLDAEVLARERDRSLT